MHRDRKEDCLITYSNGESKAHDYNKTGMLYGRPAVVESIGRRKVKIGWAGYTIIRFLDGDKEAIVLSATKAGKLFKTDNQKIQPMPEKRQG